MANNTDPVKTENTRYIVSSATPDVYTDIYNNVSITALATNITSMTSRLTGVPVDFQSLVIRIKDNGTARSITWGAKFVNRGGTLPVTTVVNKITTVYLEYNIATLTWGCMNVVIESLEGVTLARLDDVDITSPANGEQLVYNSATGLWENGTPAGGGDMLASVYDTGTTGVVDTAKDVSDSPLTTTTSVASQGGLLINIDSATGDIAQTSSGFIEDEKYGVSVGIFTSTLSSKFTSSTPYGFSGRLCAYTNVTVVPAASYCRPIEINYLKAVGTFKSPVKASTKYRIKMPIYTNITYTSGAGIRVICSTYTAADAYVTDVTVATITTSGNSIYTKEFTTGATVGLLSQIYVRYDSGIVGECAVDINSMTLEEVVEPVANSLTSSSPSLVSFTAVGSTDNIDQGAASSNSNWSLNNTANYSGQSFVPTKSKLTGIVLQKKSNVGSFTGTMTVSIVNNNVTVPGSTVFATYTIPNATWNAIANDTDYVVNLPCNLTPGTTYWIRFVSSTSSATDYPRLSYNNPSVYASGGLAYGTDGVTYATSTNDLYFKTLYYKPTTNFKASQNNSIVSISADEDGFLDGSVINLTTGAFTVPDVILTRWNGATTNNSYQGLDVNKYNAFYTATNVNWTAGTTYNIISPTTATPANGYVTKFQGLGFNEITTSIYVANVGGTNVAGLAYSYDGVNYTEFATVTDDTEGGVLQSFTLNTAGNSEVYISLYRKSGSDLRIYEYKFSGTVDVSSLSTLRNYPTNKDIVNVFTKSLSSATTTAIYRATKFGFPAIEYTNGDYQFLNIDTTATSSVVSFSADGTSYTTVADGDSIVLTSTVNPTVYVKTNITANRIYLSSNDYNASSDKDGSNKQTVVYNVTSQGLRYSVDELHNEVNELKAALPSTTTKLVTITGDILEKADAYTIVPTANTTIDLVSIPAAGKRFSIIVRTSGTSLYTLTFGTGFKSTGTLDTGTIDSKYFTVNFISDGAQGIETSRTTAM